MPVQFPEGAGPMLGKGGRAVGCGVAVGVAVGDGVGHGVEAIGDSEANDALTPGDAEGALGVISADVQAVSSRTTATAPAASWNR
jgi:hypothetical protein